MRTKQKARPRVSSFDSLEPALEGTKSYNIDIEGQGLANNLHSASKRACTSTNVTAAICADIRPVRDENSTTHVISDKFNVTSGCGNTAPVLPFASFQHATPVISKQGHIPDVEGHRCPKGYASTPANEYRTGTCYALLSSLIYLLIKTYLDMLTLCAFFFSVTCSSASCGKL